MKYNRVFFVVPPFPNKYGAPTHPNPSIGYLAVNLNKSGIKTGLLDMRLGYSIEDVLERAAKFKPDLVGMTMMSYYHNLAYEVIAALKNAGYTVVIGGPHVSSVREEVLEKSQADMAVVREGEVTLLEICKGKPIESIRGVIYRSMSRLPAGFSTSEVRSSETSEVNSDAGSPAPSGVEGCITCPFSEKCSKEPPAELKIISNPDRSYNMRLDDLPFPDYKNGELQKYARKRIPIMTSRGCPYQCIYCPIKVTMGRKYRFRSSEHVIEELKYWYKRGYREFDFQDDNFTVRKDRVYKICDLIEKENLKDLYLLCGNGIRADLVDGPLLKRMYEVGWRNIAFGVESGNPEVLKRCKKGESLEKIETAIKSATDIGFETTLFFIIGLPGSTYKKDEDSIKLAYKYPIAIASYYNLIPFPNTELFEWVTENNYLLKSPKEYLNFIAHGEQEPIFETPEYSASDRLRMLRRTFKVSRDLRRRDAVRKMGGAWWAKILAGIIYTPFINRALFFALQRLPLFKRFLNSVMQRFNIRFYI